MPALGSPLWTPGAWRAHAAAQQPAWPDAAALERVLAELSELPPLVFASEARRLRAALGEVAQGRAFLLQAGDCAESFDDVSAESLHERLKLVLQMAIVLTYGAGVHVVKVGRIAGQYAKPRSSPTELVDGREIPSFRGPMVNSELATPEARVPDPGRMVLGYQRAAVTLNLLRGFATGGFADLGRVHTWNREFVASSPAGRRYEGLADEIQRALRFMRACGVDVERDARFRSVDLWTSHEALLLDFEEALTRRDAESGEWFDGSAHLLWIGERTRAVDGAHVAFLAGVANPIAVKLGPAASADDVLRLCERLDPAREPGRLTLIARMGARQVRERLPALVSAVRSAGFPVVWASDPMHGNTALAADGRKTRHFDDVIGELEGFFDVCRAASVWPGGIHVELTAGDVTECLGGGDAVRPEDLGLRYTTTCDPRLNGRQSLDLAFRVAERLRG